MVESCCWFGFMFLVCSTLLRAFGCAAHLIPPIQQETIRYIHRFAPLAALY
jgi:hypothetical protein